LQEQIPAPQLGANFFAPLGRDSNPKELGNGGPASWETSPFRNVSLSVPIGAPFRVTGGAPEIANVGKVLLTKMAAGDIETAALAPTPATRL
jgi:hypothetical protein